MTVWYDSVPELPLWQRYYAKATQPFFKSYCKLHPTLWIFFLDFRFLLLFKWEALVIQMPTARTASLPRYCTKNHSALLQKLLWITSNIMKLLSRYQVLAAFQPRSHRNTGRCLLPELPLWQRHHAKNYLAFLQKFIWITSNIMKQLFESQNSPARKFSKLSITSNMHLSAI